MSADDDRQWLLRRVSGATVRRMRWCVAPPEKYREPGNKPPVVESELIGRYACLTQCRSIAFDNYHIEEAVPCQFIITPPSTIPWSLLAKPRHGASMT